jgi:hypothetical protein
MTNEENRKIFALADHAVDEIDLALGNEFELDARNRVEQILLKTVAQAIREAKVEAYDHWLDFVQKLHAGLTAAKDAAEKDPTYCEQNHDALQELQYMEKGARHIYEQLLGSYDALRDSLVLAEVSS